MIKKNWFPPLSPHSLIQEHLFPNEWLILASCIFLNCTSRKQVQKMMPFFAKECDSPQTFLQINEETIKANIRQLGFVNRRYDRLKSLATYLINNPGWTNPKLLPGIGQYGADAWNLFCNDVLPDAPPSDGSLVLYWNWITYQNAQNKRSQGQEKSKV